MAEDVLDVEGDVVEVGVVDGAEEEVLGEDRGDGRVEEDAQWHHGEGGEFVFDEEEGEEGEGAKGEHCDDHGGGPGEVGPATG